MDHIAAPSHPALPPLTVPYLVKSIHKFSGEPFLEFPGLKHLVCDQRHDGIRNRDTMEGVAFPDSCSFVQSWLFFALLQDLGRQFAIDINPAMFILVDRNQNHVISTEKLPSLLLNMSARFKDFPQKHITLEDPTQGFASMQRYVQPEITLIRHWQTRPKRFFSSFDLDDEQCKLAKTLILSISLVLEGLVAVLKLHQLSPVGMHANQDILREYLAEAKWCPNLIEKIYRRPDSSVGSLYYLGRMGNVDKENHDGCTATTCTHAVVDEETYEQSHAAGCDRANCQDLIVEDFNLQNRDRPISRLLRSDKLPLVSVDSTKNPPRIKVESYDVELAKPFVAISHVWAQGLGNVKKNAIRSCQAIRLQRLVNTLYKDHKEPVTFWLDTLCVPLEPGTRALAIARMKVAYEMSEKVLVLDYSLFEAPEEANLDEILMRITTSTWGMRLWTLQESLYARTLFFQLKNQAVTFQQMWDQCLQVGSEVSVLQPMDDVDPESLAAAQQSESIMRMFINPLFAQGLHHLRRLAQFSDLQALPAGSRLASFQATLAFRSTSKPRDEVLCLASLLDKSPGDLLSLPSSDRTVALFHSLDTVPVGLLFSSRERHSQCGSRWIPRSLLWDATETGVPLFQKYGTATVDTRGMIVCLPGLRFKTGITPLRNFPHVVAIVLEEVGTYGAAIMHDHGNTLEWVEYQDRDSALVFAEVPGSKGLATECVLVVVDEERDGRIYAEWQANVAFARLDMVVEVSREELGELPAYAHSKLLVEQEWCIG